MFVRLLVVRLARLPGQPLSARAREGIRELLDLRLLLVSYKPLGTRPPPMNRRRAVYSPQGLRPLVLAP